MLSVKQGKKELAHQLIKLGAGIDTPSSDGSVPLHYACMMRDNDLIQALLAKGANPNVENNFGAKPADYYLYQQSELDSRRTYLRATASDNRLLFSEKKTPDNKLQKMPIFLRDATLPDFQHITFHRALNEKSAPDASVMQALKIAPPNNKFSANFKKHLDVYYKKALDEQLSYMREYYDPLNAFHQKYAKHMDELMNKKSLGQQDSHTRYSLVNVDIFNSAKEAFIKHYLNNYEKQVVVSLMSSDAENLNSTQNSLFAAKKDINPTFFNKPDVSKPDDRIRIHFKAANGADGSVWVPSTCTYNMLKEEISEKFGNVTHLIFAGRNVGLNLDSTLHPDILEGDPIQIVFQPVKKAGNSEENNSVISKKPR